MLGIESPRCVIENNIPIWDWSIVPSQCFTIVGIDENFSENEIQIYPNPADKKIKIQIDNFNTIDDKLGTIYNLHGAIIRKELLTSSIIEIDISELKNGMYFISIGSASKKLIVQH